MFKIGEFSRLSRVTVKALRHYDELGLLRPARVDRFTGYRYYSADQLLQLHRILALRDLGLSLEQIGRLLQQGLPAAELRGMLRLKEAEIRQHLADEEGRLRRVAALLQQIEQEETMPPYEVIVKEVPAQRVAAIRDVIPTYAAQGPLWEELSVYQARHGLRSTGPCLTVYHNEEYTEHDVDAEVCEPVDAPIREDGRARVYDLPPVLVAATLHHGPYDGLGAAYGAMMGWIGANGYRICGPEREIYLRNTADHAADPENLLTEIQFPVERSQ